MFKRRVKILSKGKLQMKRKKCEIEYSHGRLVGVLYIPVSDF